MSTNEEYMPSLYATAAETVDNPVTRAVPDQDGNATGPSENIELNDASVTDFLSRPGNFVIDAEFMDSIYHPDRLYEPNQISSDEFDASNLHDADDQHEVNRHRQSEFRTSEYSVNQPGKIYQPDKNDS